MKNVKILRKVPPVNSEVLVYLKNVDSLGIGSVAYFVDGVMVSLLSIECGRSWA